MVLRKKPKERLPERKNPGDPEPEWCSPGSIEQELDMCESGSLRGDDILHSHGLPIREYTDTPPDLDQILNDNWNIDLSEENREGDEMTGDDHSSGLEGGEPEIENQPHIMTGLPGDRTLHEELTHLEVLFSPLETEPPNTRQTRLSPHKDVKKQARPVRRKKRGKK